MPRSLRLRAQGRATSFSLEPKPDPHPDAKCSEFAHKLTEQRDLGFPNPCATGREQRGRNG
jgi:hypothetical protein